MPTIRRINPIVAIENPDVVVVTAQRKMAPIAINTSDVPTAGMPVPYPIGTAMNPPVQTPVQPAAGPQ